MNIFFNRLCMAREKKGLKKIEMARKLGFSASRYQRYESERIPEAGILVEIAKILGVSVDWLLGIIANDESASYTANSCLQCQLKDLKIKMLNLKIEGLESDMEYQKAYLDEALKIINNVKPEYN